MRTDLYNFKFRYDFKKGDSVKWNRIIFKCCPFETDEIKVVGEIRKETKDFVGVEGVRNWWNWWELIPVVKHKRLIYWIRYKRLQREYKRLQREIDNLD